jgi:hypothetical protein
MRVAHVTVLSLPVVHQLGRLDPLSRPARLTRIVFFVAARMFAWKQQRRDPDAREEHTIARQLADLASSPTSNQYSTARSSRVTLWI